MNPDERRRQRIVALLLVPAAVLVAGLLLLLRLHFQPPVVPPYTVASDAGTTGARVVDVARGGAFSIELRPTRPVTGAVAARGFLLRGDEVRPWDPPFEVTRDGTVRIAGPVETLFAGVPAGDWDVAVAVGRPENLPTAPRDVLRARDADGGIPVWHLVRERIHLG